MSYFIRSADLRKINSMTKYPSIPTYHKLGDRGMLTDEVQVRFNSHVHVTEKIDGTNARIIFTPDQEYLIGSREELLYARGDLIGNPDQGIVAALKDVAESIRKNIDVYSFEVFYFEVYGGKIGPNAKQYTGKGTVGHRMFDHADLTEVYDEMLKRSAEEIAMWRQNVGQPFSPYLYHNVLADRHQLLLTPRIRQQVLLGQSIEETYEWLKDVMDRSHCLLDEGGKDRPEGVVVRDDARLGIAKIRFEDYERTLKRRAKLQTA